MLERRRRLLELRNDDDDSIIGLGAATALVSAKNTRSAG
jgi:hypothetical protein